MGSRQHASSKATGIVDGRGGGAVYGEGKDAADSEIGALLHYGLDSHPGFLIAALRLLLARPAYGYPDGAFTRSGGKHRRYADFGRIEAATFAHIANVAAISVPNSRDQAF
jgi:hypothetical protein